MAVMPAVFSPLHCLQLAVHCALALLPRCTTGTNITGPLPTRVLTLLGQALQPLQHARVNYIGDASMSEISPELRLTQGLCTLMLSCPVADVRQTAFQCFDGYVSTFNAAAK